MTAGARWAVAAAAAVVAAGAASLAAISALTAAPARPPAAAPPKVLAAAPEPPPEPTAAAKPIASPEPARAAETVAAPAPARASAPSAGPPPAARSLQLARRATPFAAPGTPWEAVPPASRPPPALSRAIEDARPRLARCFDADVQAREGRAGEARRGGLPAGPGAPVLLLEIEVAGGQARVVGAPVLARGSAEDGLLACAQDALRGVRFGAGALPAGSRLRVRCPLAGMMAALAPAYRAPRLRARPR